MDRNIQLEDFHLIDRLLSYLAAAINLAIEILPGVCQQHSGVPETSTFICSKLETPRACVVVIGQALLADQRSVVHGCLAEIRSAIDRMEEAFLHLDQHEGLPASQRMATCAAISQAYGVTFFSIQRLGEAIGIRAACLDRQALRSRYYQQILARLPELFMAGTMQKGQKPVDPERALR